MNKEDKELLVKDLSARLPFGVICFCGHDAQLKLVCPDGDYCVIQNSPYAIETVKPYLRPISSMTEEEKVELQKITNNIFHASFNSISNSNPPVDFSEWHVSHNNFVTNAACNKLISWLDEKHFDHRTDEEGKTLSEKGLALVAPEGMYKI